MTYYVVNTTEDDILCNKYHRSIHVVSTTWFPDIVCLFYPWQTQTLYKDAHKWPLPTFQGYSR